MDGVLVAPMRLSSDQGFTALHNVPKKMAVGMITK
jgi:hypothetical protein